jgi:hypothetical protein
MPRRPGPRLLRRLPRLALCAVAKSPKQDERVQTGRMAAFKRDLKRVLANQCDVLHAQLIRVQVLDASKTSRHAGLAATLRARTCPAQSLGGIGAAMTVLPRDDHDLAFAVDIDGERKGVGVFQGRRYRTLMTGNCRND